jgi:hypothetical protein
MMEALKCPSCKAPLSVSPDDAVITCSFCGFTATIEGEQVANHSILPPTCNAAEVREKVQSWVGRGGKAVVTEAGLRFVPYWVESMHASTQYEGYRVTHETEYYTDSKGQRQSRTITLYEPVRGAFTEDPSVNVLCRRGAAFYSQGALDKALQVDKKSVIPFDFKQVTRVESKPLFLNSELTDPDAYEIAETTVSDQHRKRAEATATKIWDCNTQIQKTGSYLLHVPHWLIRYRFGKETYRVGINGFTKNVLKGEVPVSGGFRALMFVLSVVGLLVAVLGAHFAAELLAAQEMELIAYAVVVLGAVLAAVGTWQRFKISSEKHE